MRKPLIGLILAGLLLPTSSAHAYIDPGTGSMLLQGLIAAVAAGLLTFKLWWRKLKGLLDRRRDAASRSTEGGPREEQGD